MPLYILRLQGGRYYIGKSNNVENRYKQHVNGQGSSWTKKYPPISLERTIDNASPFDEDKVTKEYMLKHGIDKVRGGSYTEVELSEFQKEALNMEIWGATDVCKQCGRKGHWIKDCYAKTDVTGNKIVYEDEVEDEDEGDVEDDVYECDYCDRTFTTAFGCSVHEKSCKPLSSKAKTKQGVCYRCGRSGHYSPDCYATTHSKGYTLDSD